MFVCAEALGPVRFAGWDHDGRPIGRPVQAPYVPCAATEEGQADNAYGAVVFMLQEGAIARTEGLDVGLTRTFVPNGGKIQPITARARSKDGGKETFAVFDETHLYVTDELRNLHATIRRNLAKRKQAEPWSLETSTMYAPGEESVAEHSHRYWNLIRGGQIDDPTFLFDHRQAPVKLDFGDDDQLRAALVDAYGEAAEWIDIERLLLEARDPDTDEGDFRRYFLNQPTDRKQGKWIHDDRWEACQSELAPPPRAIVTIGVDAARTRDTTACVWSWKAKDGTIVQRCRVWSCVEGRPAHVFVPGGRLDNNLVRDYIRDELMRQFTPRLLFFDERYFDTQANDLSKDGLTVVEMHQSKPEMQAAWDGYYAAVHAGPKPSVAHDGDEIFAAHVRKAVGIKTERGWKVSKRTGDVIDALAAAVMSHYAAVHFEDFRARRRRVASW